MGYILIASVFIIGSLFFTVLLSRVYWPTLNIQYRLYEISKQYEQVDLDERKVPFKYRIIYPAIKKIKNIISRLTPEKVRANLEQQLIEADYPFGLRVNGWIAIKVISILVIPVLTFLILRPTPIQLLQKLLIFVGVTVLSVLVPRFVLINKIKERRKKIEQQLPDALDLLTVSVEAGLSFDGALARVAEKGRDELAKEIKKTLEQIQVGKTRRQALIDLTKRCEVGDLKVFVSSMIQAEQLGVSIGKILRIQSDQMRDKRMQRAREEAMKTPIKMLFPLIFFIFPSIFIAILGPAMIQIKTHLLDKSF